MRVTREGAAMELVVLDLGAGELRVSFSMAITNSTYNPCPHAHRPSVVRPPAVSRSPMQPDRPPTSGPSLSASVVLSARPRIAASALASVALHRAHTHGPRTGYVELVLRGRRDYLQP